ncbi:DUF2637 domain-containing protein [Nocardia aobensis]|uniref:DUF2637 domain-containing protein n=1 Tax=Nocardia aobensis TaxID=257277 RepID=A0ABW6NX27_9NOCA
MTGRYGPNVVCTAVVAVGAAYASYRHGREFAVRYGADSTTAGIWPVIVDGLLTLATVELWKTGRDQSAGGRVGGLVGIHVRNLPVALREHRGGPGAERVQRRGGRVPTGSVAAGGRVTQPCAETAPRRD